MKSFLEFISKVSPKMIEALERMRDEAISIGVNTGVSKITVLHEDILGLELTLSKVTTLTRANVEGKSDVNYKGVVSSKIAQMQRTGEFSGKDECFIGEVPYRGGSFFKKGDYIIYVAYSGGTEEQDLIITGAGMREMDSIE